MENIKTFFQSMWLIIVGNSEEDNKVKTENLEDIPASHCESAKVSEEQIRILKASLAKLEGKKPKKEEKEQRNNFVQERYSSGNAGGSQRNIVADGNKQMKEPDDYQIGG